MFPKYSMVISCCLLIILRKKSTFKFVTILDQIMRCVCLTNVLSPRITEAHGLNLKKVFENIK